MLPNTSAYTAILFAASVMAQTLNSWTQKNVDRDENYTDGDINTVEVTESPFYDGRFSVIFDNPTTMSGLYILSSGDDFITDYKVRAVFDTDDVPVISDIGRVCGAIGNFTFVPLVNPRDGKPPRSPMWAVDVSSTKLNSTTYRINEIWPVYPGDEVVDPQNTSPCPADVPK